MRKSNDTPRERELLLCCHEKNGKNDRMGCGGTGKEGSRWLGIEMLCRICWEYSGHGHGEQLAYWIIVGISSSPQLMFLHGI
jgi:hypothetical protein